MRVLVIGGGGREHAIIKKIKQNKKVTEIYAVPGNGGIAMDATCENISVHDGGKILAFALEHQIDYAIVTPDDPLVEGLVDILEAKGIKCFGPSQKAAMIEGSKAFAKLFMTKYSIPTAKFTTTNSFETAKDFIINHNKYPVVIKADGLALGKGVVIAQCEKEALDTLKSFMIDKKFGKSGDSVVIEEYLTGPEVSVLTFTDGKTVVPMVSSMDHKRAKDNDEGLNTGGMGTIAPNPYYTKEIEEICKRDIFYPTINGLLKDGRPFKGCLYFGLMITKDGPKVIEYNCRFGDPETQVVLPLLKTDLLDIMMAVTEERLDEINIEFYDDSCCCVIMASDGYPLSYEKGFPIDIPDDLSDYVYVAGAKRENGTLLTNGGRVLGVVAREKTLQEAVKKAYERTGRIKFENAFYRKDIGKKALKALEE